MNTLLILTLLVLGVSSMLLLWKKDQRLVAIFHVLFAVVLLQWSAGHFDKSGALAIEVLTGVLVVTYLIAQFLPKKPLVGALVSTALVLGAFFAVGTGEMTIHETASKAETKFVVAAIIVAAFLPVVARGLVQFIAKVIDGFKPSAWSTALAPLFAGIGFLLSSLTAPVYGPLLIGSAFLINSFFGDKRSGITGVTVFVLASLPIVLIDQTVSVSLLNADVVAGLLFGAFAVFLLTKVWSERKSLLPVLLGYGLIFGVVIGFTYAGSIFEQMGGMDTYLAIVIGAAIVHAIKGKTYQGVSLFAPVLAFGLFVPSILVNEALEEAEKSIIKIGETTRDENGEEQAGPVTLPLSELSGNFTIESSASQVQFELGKEGGRTKGRFKQVSGSFYIPDNLENARLKVSLKMEDFTTFNSMRDESLRDEAYFKTDKFPGMSYEAVGFIDKGSNLFETSGTFTMLGVSKQVTVTLQRIENEGSVVLIGSGSLDRTEFGMTPSAAEGNVVDFNYQVELIQK